jgi:solute carrier family 25 oxoglutarate transporter 11
MGAAMFCHPFDVVRVTMQVNTGEARSTLGTAMYVFKESGLKRGLYSGLSAAFLRQWTYGSCRIGIYSFLLKSQEKPSQVSFLKKLSFGLLSGGLGCVAGTPSELALVRMSADARKPLAERRGMGVHVVLGEIIKKDGVAGMWLGVGPTVARGMIVSAGTLAITSECKDRLPGIWSGFASYPTLNMMISTTIASLGSTAASQPLDVVKSRMQNMVVPEGGTPPYSGVVDCFGKCLAEGPMTLMKGFTPTFAKLTPYTMISLILAENITKALTGKSAL